MDISSGFNWYRHFSIIGYGSYCCRGGNLIKGGKFMELFAKTDTIVFDKTGIRIRNTLFCSQRTDFSCASRWKKSRRKRKTRLACVGWSCRMAMRLKRYFIRGRAMRRVWNIKAEHLFWISWSLRTGILKERRSELDETDRMQYAEIQIFFCYSSLVPFWLPLASFHHEKLAQSRISSNPGISSRTS